MSRALRVAPARRRLALALAMCLASAVCTNALADPMRPLNPPSPPNALLYSSSVNMPNPSKGSPAAPATSGLVATRRVADGPWQALVGERWLKAGDRMDGAVVQQVGADRVVLLRSGQRETLQWLPVLEPSPSPRAIDSPSVAKRPARPLHRGTP